MRLQKHHTITRLIPRLRKHLGAGAFHIVDHWDADLCAIGIARPDNHAVLVYICTFGLPNGRHFASLELPAKSDDKDYRAAGEYRSLTFGKLVELIRKHLST
jgi:hypothetical protein